VATFSAEWIIPVTGKPIRTGYITVGDGRILAIDRKGPDHALHLGRIALLPALVNAHTHLELSFLHGRIPPSESFNDWVMAMMAVRRASTTDPRSTTIVDAARQAIKQARASGTGLVGDVSNTLATVPVLRDAKMPAHVFHELIGFNPSDAAGRVRQAREAVDAERADDGDVRISLAPHAPYSVAPSLFKAIREDVSAHVPALTSVHLGESAAEVELLRHGTGAARKMLEKLGVWTDAWTPPGVSPVAYLDGLGFLDARTLIVHGVQFDGGDLARVRASGATLVSCPRSNLYVGVGSPPLESFYDADVPVAFGTDSLASVADVNMFNELAEARRIAPRVSAHRLLESATLTGARALGFDREFGSIEVGKRPIFAAVHVPRRHVPDMEEYLVSGLEADAIRGVIDLTEFPATRA
jgi:cytosine/adenosine deaminase-related metal-dependent hydrolase